jgi:hypothetical protein
MFSMVSLQGHHYGDGEPIDGPLRDQILSISISLEKPLLHIAKARAGAGPWCRIGYATAVLYLDDQETGASPRY